MLLSIFLENYFNTQIVDSGHPWSRLTLGFFLNVHEQTLFYSVLGPYLYVVVALYSLHFEGKWI